MTKYLTGTTSKGRACFSSQLEDMGHHDRDSMVVDAWAAGHAASTVRTQKRWTLELTFLSPFYLFLHPPGHILLSPNFRVSCPIWVNLSTTSQTYPVANIIYVITRKHDHACLLGHPRYSGVCRQHESSQFTPFLEVCGHFVYCSLPQCIFFHYMLQTFALPLHFSHVIEKHFVGTLQIFMLSVLGAS